MSNDTEERELYRELWKNAVEMEERVAHNFDRAMLTLSAGALGISVTFIQNIAPQPIYKPFLGLAWVALVVSLLTMLISMLESQQGLRRYREILDARRAGNQAPKTEENHPATTTYYLNIASISAFIIGVIFLAVFSFVNLRDHDTKERSLMGNRESNPTNTQSSSHEQKGLVAPKPPTSPSNVPISEGLVAPKPPAPTQGPSDDGGGKK